MKPFSDYVSAVCHGVTMYFEYLERQKALFSENSRRFDNKDLVFDGFLPKKLSKVIDNPYLINLSKLKSIMQEKDAYVTVNINESVNVRGFPLVGKHVYRYSSKDHILLFILYGKVATMTRTLKVKMQE